MLDAADFKGQVIEMRRTQILMGAAQVFAKKGYHKATTKAIAQAAGVSEGTIYNYFSSKRELLLAMVAMFAAQNFKEKVLQQPPDDPRAFLKLILRDRYQLLQERGHLLIPLVAEIFLDSDLREAVYNEIMKPVVVVVEQYLQKQIDSGRLRPINPLIVARSLIGTMILNSGFKLTGLDSRYDAISTEEMIDQIASLFMDGLLMPED